MLNKLFAPPATNWKRAYDSLRKSNENLLETYERVLRENQRCKAKLKQLEKIEKVYAIPNLLEESEKIPFSTDNAKLANAVLKDGFLESLVDQLIKERMYSAIVNSADNKQFSIIVASTLGIKCLIDELKKYASYIDEEEDNDFDKYSIT